MSSLGKANSKNKNRRDRPVRRDGHVLQAPTGNARRPRRWLVWLLACVCLVGAAAATYYLVDFVLWPRIPSALVGTWQVKGGKQNGVTLEFRANGAFQAKAQVGGKVGAVYGTAVIEPDNDKALTITSTDASGQRIKKTHIIRALTENELTLEDPTGEVSRLVRLE